MRLAAAALREEGVQALDITDRRPDAVHVDGKLEHNISTTTIAGKPNEFRVPPLP